MNTKQANTLHCPHCGEYMAKATMKGGKSAREALIAEHTALVAVAEAAQRLAVKMGSTLESECKRDLNSALNTLSAVRNQK